MIWKKKSFLVFLSLSLFLGFSTISRNVSASQNINSWLSFQVSQKTSSGGSYSTRTITNGSVLTYTSGYVAIASMLASGSVSNLSGSAWSGSGYLNITIDNSVSGDGFICPNAVQVFIRPEQGTRVSESSQVVSCSLTSQNLYYKTWTIEFQSSGTLSQVTTARSFFVGIIGSETAPVVQYTYVPGQTSSVQLTGVLNFTMTTDANTSVLGEINQSITNQTIIIQSELQNVQELQEQQLEISQQTYDFLTDTTPPSADTSILNGSAGWLPPGPVDSILTLPVQLAQGILNVFTGSNTCAPINVPLGIIDYTLQIPCMSPYFDIAQVNIVWNVVGAIISAFLIYNTLKWLYKFVDDTLTLRENNSTMWGGL